MKEHFHIKWHANLAKVIYRVPSY